MNITVKKRTRIAEIIVGIVIVYFSFINFRNLYRMYVPNIDYIDKEAISYLFIPALYTPFSFVFAVMLTLRQYHSKPIKILYCITVLGLLLNTIGGLVLLGHFFEPYSHFTEYLSFRNTPHIYILLAYLTLLLILTAAVVGFLTMNRNIVWKSRKKLLTYTYVMTSIYIAQSLITSQSSFYVIMLFMLPCLIQDYTENKNTKGIIGCTAFVAKPILPVLIGYIYAHYASSPAGGHSFLETLQIKTYSEQNDSFIFFMNCLHILLVLLTPLMIFERNVGEVEETTSKIGIIKKLDSVLFKDDEDTDDDEYEYEYEDEEEYDNR